MITLFQYQPAFGLPNASPFCMKVEVFLKMANLDYKTKVINDPSKAPNGKLPYISDENETIADSAFILQHLTNKHKIDLNQNISDRDLAIADAVVRMLEEHYYWSLVYSRWIDERYWPATKKSFFAGLPLPLRFIIPSVARGKVKTQIFQQGTSRHNADKIYQLGIDDINTASSILADNDFIAGSEPCVHDAAIYAFLANALHPEPNTPLKEHIKHKPNLVEYCERMRTRYFS
ncbi:hypothetical protein A9Q81_26910 [Gammaproteobacteria bacterium 42_54_T18]|nr:hypothetical protein A9Q81_26910 [Gammaproteobacteria bacterium 42_54_T18]